MNILAAEDNELLARLLTKTIESLGWSCTIARNGIEAIEKAGSEKFDVILLDINMPGIDGYEAARWMNKNIPPENRPMIIALTGMIEEDPEELCKKYGFDAWLTKPVQAATLKKVLAPAE